MLEIFDIKRTNLEDEQSMSAFIENCLIFYTMLVRPNDQLSVYVSSQIERQPVFNETENSLASINQDYQVSPNLQ